jgi:hypothetical protein
MYICLYVKLPSVLTGFNENWIFSTDFLKSTVISNIMKILPMGHELFHADGQTDRGQDMPKLIADFKNFWERV